MNSFIAQITDESSMNGFIMVQQPQAEAPAMELSKRTTLGTLGTAGTITTAGGGDNITATETANTSGGKSCGVNIKQQTVNTAATTIGSIHNMNRNIRNNVTDIYNDNREAGNLDHSTIFCSILASYL